jgi:DNA-binding CsgD family transcriptional regulator
VAAQLTGALAPAVLHLVTNVLEALDHGTGGRNHLCEGAATLFGCGAIGHAWLDATAACWSVCLWRDVREGARSLTLSQPEEPGVRWPASAWWPVSTCRRVTLDWMVMPHLAEVPLSQDDHRCGVLVLGRDHPFGLEDTRRVDSASRHLALMERIVLRTEPPALPGGSARHDVRPLTDREREVLMLLSEGLMARSIAQRIDVSERTVHKHLGSVYRKLQVHDRLLAVARGVELGLIPAPRGRAPAMDEQTAG